MHNPSDVTTAIIKIIIAWDLIYAKPARLNFFTIPWNFLCIPGNVLSKRINRVDSKKIKVPAAISAPRFNNYRPYVIAGVAPMYDLTTGKHEKLQVKPFTLMLEAGMGCDLYMPFFKFIPELKFCFGLGNVFKKKRNDLTDPSQMVYTQSIDRATVGMVVLSFYFE